MAKILGKYIVRASLDDFADGFTFANGDRDQRLTVNDDAVLNFECTDITRPLNNAVSFVSNNVLKIRAVRILTTGAEGLRGGLDDKAANILFKAFADNTTTTPVGTFQVLVDRFNEWCPVNIDFMARSAPNQNFFIGIDHTYSFLSLDDYNIDENYVGQGFVPYVELDIDTAGIFDYDGKLV
jgi:hypothetical protein